VSTMRVIRPSAQQAILQVMLRLLYLFTGAATAIPVVWALGWAAWGAGVSITEYVSLLGSMILVASAAVSSSKRTFAARLALIGAVAVWSFYIPAILGYASVRLSDQELGLTVLLWTPSTSPLVIQQPAQSPNTPSTRLSARDVEQIEAAGLRGELSFYAANDRYGSGKKSHITIVMQRPITDPVELKEPDATSVVYVQGDHGWRMFPADAPTLKRTIRLEPIAYGPNSPGAYPQTSVMVELSSGARQGFGVLWRTPDSGRTVK
jgi:hypothetical protein